MSVINVYALRIRRTEDQRKVFWRNIAEVMKNVSDFEKIMSSNLCSHVGKRRYENKNMSMSTTTL